MTFRERIIIRILLIIAAMFAEDAEIKKEIKNLDTHIRVERDRMAA